MAKSNEERRNKKNNGGRTPSDNRQPQPQQGRPRSNRDRLDKAAPGGLNVSFDPIFPKVSQPQQTGGGDGLPTPRPPQQGGQQSQGGGGTIGSAVGQATQALGGIAGTVGNAVNNVRGAFEGLPDVPAEPSFEQLQGQIDAGQGRANRALQDQRGAPQADRLPDAVSPQEAQQALQQNAAPRAVREEFSRRTRGADAAASAIGRQNEDLGQAAQSAFDAARAQGRDPNEALQPFIEAANAGFDSVAEFQAFKDQRAQSQANTEETLANAQDKRTEDETELAIANTEAQAFIEGKNIDAASAEDITKLQTNSQETIAQITADVEEAGIQAGLQGAELQAATGRFAALTQLKAQQGDVAARILTARIADNLASQGADLSGGIEGADPQARARATLLALQQVDAVLGQTTPDLDNSFITDPRGNASGENPPVQQPGGGDGGSAGNEFPDVTQDNADLTQFEDFVLQNAKRDAENNPDLTVQEAFEKRMQANKEAGTGPFREGGNGSDGGEGGDGATDGANPPPVPQSEAARTVERDRLRTMQSELRRNVGFGRDSTFFGNRPGGFDNAVESTARLVQAAETLGLEIDEALRDPETVRTVARDNQQLLVELSDRVQSAIGDRLRRLDAAG